LYNKKGTPFIASWINREALNRYYPEIFSQTNLHEIYWDEEGIMQHFKKAILGSGIEWLTQVINSKGVEVRFAFLNHKLLEFMAGLPNHMKVRPNETKYILRKSLQGIMPEKIRKRKSKTDHQYLVTKGFEKEWFQLSDYLDFSNIKEMGFVSDESQLKEKVYMYYSGINATNSLEFEGILRALVLEIWLSKKLKLKGGE